MDWEGSVVGFNDGIRYLGGGNYGESLHNSIGIFFSYLRDKESTHTWTGTTTQWVGDLETLKAITSLSLLSDDIEYWINKFSTFSIMSLSPVVTSTTLSEDEVIGSEELSEGSSTDGVHSTGFKIHQDSSGDVSTTSGFIEVNVDSL